MLQMLKTAVRRVVRPPLHKPERIIAYEVLGSSYGGWPLLNAHTPRGALVYSFGVGEDVSFDVAAIERFDCTVHAFDPTPRCLAWINGQVLPDKFSFHPVGLSDTDGEIEFFAPEKEEYVSFSSAPAPASDLQRAVKAPVKRLETLVADLGTAMPDIVKMDIEGFEYGVIDDLLSGPIRPGQLLIEFHHRMYEIPTMRTQESVKKLQDAGYILFYVSSGGHEYGFVHVKLIS